MALFEVKQNIIEVDDKYSSKIKPPQYLPKSICPDVRILADVSKYNALLRNINIAKDIPDDVKAFLKLGATRHIVFDYSKIADYYAHTTPEIQRLMEESALVIIDIDDAIANGYVRLSKTISDIMKESGVKANEK